MDAFSIATSLSPFFCGTSKWITNNDSFCVFFEWKLAGSELSWNITNAFTKNLIIFAHCSLNESGLPFISDNNHEPAFIHVLIQTVIQCYKTKALLFQNFLEHHHILKTFLLTTTMRWKDQIKYDLLMYYLFCIHVNILLLLMINNIWSLLLLSSFLL